MKQTIKIEIVNSTIRLPREMHLAATSIARSEGQSFSSFVRALIATVVRERKVAAK